MSRLKIADGLSLPADEAGDDVNPQPAPEVRPDPDTPPVPVPQDLEEKLNRILLLLTEIRANFR